MFRKRLLTGISLMAVLASVLTVSVPTKAEGNVIPVDNITVQAGVNTPGTSETVDETGSEDSETLIATEVQTEKKLPAAGVAATLKEGTDFVEVKVTADDALQNTGNVSLDSIQVKVSDTEISEITGENGNDAGIEAGKENNAGSDGEDANTAGDTDSKDNANEPEEAKEIRTSNIKEMNPDAICLAGDYVHLRKDASEFSETTGVFYRNAVAEILSEENEWYQIKSGNVTGYVRKSLVATGEEAQEEIEKSVITTATVDKENLMVRVAPNMNASAEAILPENEELEVLAVNENWVQIRTDEGIGYVYKPYTTVTSNYITALTQDEITEEEKEELRRVMIERARTNIAYNAVNGQPEHFMAKEDSNEKGQEVADFAVQFVGNPYVWGGVSLTDGCDCSGFVMSVYEQFGFNLTHSTEIDQTEGVAVENIESAEAGDIVCYQGHVAIYIGDGMIVHAAGEAKGIIISMACYDDIITVRRMFPEEE